MGYGQLSIDTVVASARYLDIVTYMSVYDIVRLLYADITNELGYAAGGGWSRLTGFWMVIIS